jgi:5,10-methylenetetrahydromethanopterin reductase
MEYGVHLPTSSFSWKVVKRAEELGFTHAWFFDTELLNAEMFVAMAAAAMKTERIKLGTGVMIPSNRIAPVAASGLASLNALAPGRIEFGVGTGFTARRTLGLPAVTLARLEEYIRVVQGLLNRETVEWSEEGGTHKIAFLDPQLELINLKDPIPLYISAFGPRGRGLVAKLGARWKASMPNSKAAIGALGGMQKSWTEAGRDVKDLYPAAISGGCVLADGEPYDSPRSMAQAGPSAAILFHNAVEEEELHTTMGFKFPPQFQANLDAYRKIYQSYQPADARYMANHRGHLMYLRPEETHITGDVIKAFTFTGTRSELAEQLREIKAAGFKQFNCHARTGHEMEMLENWSDVFAKV